MSATTPTYTRTGNFTTVTFQAFDRMITETFNGKSDTQILGWILDKCQTAVLPSELEALRNIKATL
ncbi:MAG: hypothetical protein KF900_14120 [Bacteroidetes bacterium]|nr:hypothetical protein [Bacteroidota bacterium]